MNLHPTLIYSYTGQQDREGVYFRFEDYGSAREAYRRIRNILREKNLPHDVKNARPEIWSGEYEFDILFYRGITRPEIWEALTKPPLSNRGVTLE